MVKEVMEEKVMEEMVLEEMVMEEDQKDSVGEGERGEMGEWEGQLEKLTDIVAEKNQEIHDLEVQVLCRNII